MIVLIKVLKLNLQFLTFFFETEKYQYDFLFKLGCSSQNKRTARRCEENRHLPQAWSAGHGRVLQRSGRAVRQGDAERS